MCCVCAFHVRLYSSISAGGTVTDRPTSNAERTAGNSQRSSRSLGCGGHSCFAVSRARGDAPFRRRCFAWLERCGGAEPPRHKKSRAVNALVCVVGLHSLLFWLSSTLPSAERFFFCLHQHENYHHVLGWITYFPLLHSRPLRTFMSEFVSFCGLLRAETSHPTPAPMR